MPRPWDIWSTAAASRMFCARTRWSRNAPARLMLKTAAATAAIAIANRAGDSEDASIARAGSGTIAIALVVYSAVLVAFTVGAHHVVTATIGLFALGFVGMSAGPALMGRLIDFAAEGPSLAAASFHSAFNVANALGAALGGAVLAAGLGYDAPAAVGAVLPLLGIVVFAISVRMERRRRA